MKSLNKKASIGAPAQPSAFTFVPLVQKLPIKVVISEEGRAGDIKGNPYQILAASHETTSGEIMSDGEIFQAEVVYIGDSVAGGAANLTHPEANLELKPRLDLVSLPPSSASVSGQSENTPKHQAVPRASMETTDNKHGGASQQRRPDTSGRAEVSSGFFAAMSPESEDRTSPASSADASPTPASSRESILSEGSDRDRSCSAAQLSALASPASLSRTVSPCSSVRSGVFSPAVIQIKRHFLAPGSSLLHIPQTCFSSCESLSSSVCPQSPPPRHRPPLTRLSLLTAILRKGRLPVLSSSVQRPYTPCWPVNPVTLSFCNACSAASSVASIPLELSSRFSSSASIDSHLHREPKRCITAPPPLRANEHSDARPQTPAAGCSEHIRSRWQQVVSPTPARGDALPRVPLPRVPLPVFGSKFAPVSPLNREETSNCATSREPPLSLSRSPEPKPANAHVRLESHADNDRQKLISPASKLINERETSEPQKSRRRPNSSLSKLHWLSQQLRSPPAGPPLLQPSRSPTATPQTATGRREPERSATPSPRGFRKAHLLSPSRYTPMVFPGWPSPSCSPAPSPAPPVRDFTPSPSPSFRSTPSPRPGSGISDYGDREGKKRKLHKIKPSYKSLAAIPTNTLLLDQQAIDEQVERESSPCHTPDGGDPDPHAEMCSPAQLRQQSEELYATIDEILANSIPASKTSPRTSTTKASVCSLHPPAGVERKLTDPKKTKPGVIRPMTAIPRLTVEDEDEFCRNPFRQFAVKETSTGSTKVEETGKNGFTRTKNEAPREERRADGGTPFSVRDLHIAEPEDHISRPGKDASTSFSPTAGRMDTFETHI